jgi:hypothetical protein
MNRHAPIFASYKIRTMNTFVQKLQAVIRKFKRYKEYNEMAKNLMRYYYAQY